jgi:CheY-like chemotaxis protein
LTGRARRVLVVEDDRERVEALKRRFRSTTVRVATNYRNAVTALALERFDLVSLDHDIDDRDRNGQDIAAFMATRLGRRRRPACVLVHSTNPAGSYGIYTTLKHAGFDVDAKPFTYALLQTRRVSLPCAPGARRGSSGTGATPRASSPGARPRRSGRGSSTR